MVALRWPLVPGLVRPDDGEDAHNGAVPGHDQPQAATVGHRPLVRLHQFAQPC